MSRLLILLLLLQTAYSLANEKTLPVLYGGRHRPLEAAARQWLLQTYHRETLLASDVEKTGCTDALELLWQIERNATAFDALPLLWVGGEQTQKFLGLEKSRCSYQQLRACLDDADVKIRVSELLASSQNRPLSKKVAELLQAVSEYERARSGHFFLVVPSAEGKWLPLSALPALSQSGTDALVATLRASYALHEKQPFLFASGKKLTYPSNHQLWIESVYVQLPIALFLATCYGLTALLWTIKRFHRFALWSSCFSLFLHTLVLCARIYVLQRPPVASMLETILYVPWVGTLLGLFLYIKTRIALFPAAASAISFLLALVVQLAHLGNNLEPVPAVLDSQLWLTVHVLMVVGSYGVFALSCAVAHVSAFQLAYGCYWRHSAAITRVLLRTVYVGTGLLIAGTILGGVWAAQSWGRFWDWDPKESWAFISACAYLIWIHAYQFNIIREFGLAVGAIAGFTIISFTWYGVNYLLGTGLHSYGFGNGGELYYLLFIGLEGLFLLVTTSVRRRRLRLSRSAPSKTETATIGPSPSRE